MRRLRVCSEDVRCQTIVESLHLNVCGVFALLAAMSSSSLRRMHGAPDVLYGLPAASVVPPEAEVPLLHLLPGCLSLVQ